MDHREYRKKRDPPMTKSFSQPAPGHNIDDVVSDASYHSFPPSSIFAPQLGQYFGSKSGLSVPSSMQYPH
jgi:hypothetical protein